MIKAGVIGATGYTGAELLRLLIEHPGVSLETVTSRAHSGETVASVFPTLACDVCFTSPDTTALMGCDVVFFATPHGVAMTMAPALLDAGVKVIDLSADFRLECADLWQKWYGVPHAAPDLLAQAVYGLPELYREHIRQAQLIANPGCYPTAIILGFAPLLKANRLLQGSMIADAKSGVSGAGRQARVNTLYADMAQDFKAYNIAGHRHLPEMNQILSSLSKKTVALTFVPHLLPMVRGIEATLYADLIDSDCGDLQLLFEDAYADEPFVDVLPSGGCPATATVKGVNYCRIAVYRPQNGNRVVVSSVIDNLVKGAAGQAVQNMNLLFGLPESTGLMTMPVWP